MVLPVGNFIQQVIATGSIKLVAIMDDQWCDYLDVYILAVISFTDIPILF